MPSAAEREFDFEKVSRGGRYQPGEDLAQSIGPPIAEGRPSIQFGLDLFGLAPSGMRFHDAKCLRGRIDGGITVFQSNEQAGRCRVRIDPAAKGLKRTCLWINVDLPVLTELNRDS